LDELGLREASKWYLNKLAKRSELTITFEADALWNRLGEDIEIACFRVLQEALTNVVKHARATTVSVKLHQTDDHLELRVWDDGVGLTAADAQTSRSDGTGLGLIGMEERLHLLGGIFNVESRTGAGTQITAKFPIRNNEVGRVALDQVAI
jgi:signal transduction histidine kinase